MKFTHLHTHSHYSLLDGLAKIDELIDYAKELGMDSLALTDHGNMYGAIEFYKKAKAKGIKPIIGCEMYQSERKMTDKEPGIDDKRYHIVLLAKNLTGYKNLVKIITKAHLEGFYYKPRVDEETLRKHSEGLIALSACLAGKIPKLILSGKIEEAEKVALSYQDIFGKENFFLDFQVHPNSKDQRRSNEGLINMAKKLQIPLVATNDIHYLKKEDAHAQDILMLINTGADPNDPERLSMMSDDFSMKSPEEMIETFKEFPEAIENTQKIADACNLELELGKTKLPLFETPNGQTPEEYLKELCYKGIEKRFGKDPTKEVGERLEYELSVINQTGFASYFLIVQDFVNWAKSNRIVVGPGRGSAGGSLVAYLVGITNIDPLKYNLLFERFLNPARISMPDIDLDFTDRRRDEVIRYVSEKYGKNRVAQIITFGTMAARAAVRDVGRALGYVYSYCDQVAKMIPFGMSLSETMDIIPEFRELYQSDEKARTLIDYAKKLEGVARHASTHACGVVIASDPLDEMVPLQYPSQGEETIVTQYEMHSIEDLGLLKMDFLGLKNLTIIEDTLARIYKVHGINIDLDNLPDGDKDVYKSLQKGDTVGIFQLESGGMQRYLKQLKPNTFEDIIAMVALYRPGPMQLIPDYIARKNKLQPVTYLHPKLKPILENTQGIAVYQEQIMKIAQEMAGFSLAEADILRKAIGKKIKELLMAQKEKFISGVKANNIDERVGRQIWDWIEPFASYSFNRSHAAAYATIAYQTAYLKSHYPPEFMSALLTSERNDLDRISTLIQECQKMKLEVLPPDVNESFTFFSVVPKKNQIRFGLSAVKNVGTGIVETIVGERKANGPYKSIEDFVTRVNTKDLNKKSLESLIKAGAFDNMEERNKLLQNMEMLLEYSRDSQKSKNSNQGGLFDGMNIKSSIRLEKAEAAPEKDKLAWEKELLGLFVSSHPLKNYKGFLEKKTTPISQLSPSGSKKIRIGGIISKIKKIITKTGKPMLFVNLEDLTDKIEVVVFPRVIERKPNAFQENKIVLVSGRVDTKDGMLKLICEDVEEIIEA